MAEQLRFIEINPDFMFIEIFSPRQRLDLFRLFRNPSSIHLHADMTSTPR